MPEWFESERKTNIEMEIEPKNPKKAIESANESKHKRD